MREMAPWLVIVGVVAFLFFGFGGFTGRSSDEAHRLVADGAVIVDVRTPAEYAAGHIDGAINIPVDQIASRSAEIGPKDQPVVVYCHSGSRSAAAASTLEAQGFATVEDLGGMRNW